MKIKKTIRKILIWNRHLKKIIKHSNILYWAVMTVAIIGFILFPLEIIGMAMITGTWIQIHMIAKRITARNLTTHERVIQNLHDKFDDYVLAYVISRPEFQAKHPQFFIKKPVESETPNEQPEPQDEKQN